MCPPNPNNTYGFGYTAQQANMSTVTSADPSKAAILCCPVVNQTTPPAGG